jgi:predicted nucleic acid-binding Zn finger protein
MQKKTLVKSWVELKKENNFIIFKGFCCMAELADGLFLLRKSHHAQETFRQLLRSSFFSPSMYGDKINE